MTTQGFGLLIDLVAQEKCSLRYLNISKCKINNLVSLGELIKKANKLKVIYADNCGFDLNNEQELTVFFKSCKHRIIHKLSLLGNDVVSDLKIF